MGIECFNGVEGDIPLMLILTSIQQLISWFNYNINNNIVITTAKTGDTNNRILL